MCITFALEFQTNINNHIFKLAIMKTSNKTNNMISIVFTNKALAALKKDLTNYRDSFKNACLMMLEVASNGNSDCRKVCQYLGITTESMKPKNISGTRKNILEKLPCYYMIEGSETHFPARLQKINRGAGIEGYVAVPDGYINALLSLAKLLSEGNSYDMRRLELSSAAIDEAANEYTEESVTFVAYDRTGAPVEADKQIYVDWLNRNRLANDVAKQAKAAYLSK